MRKFWRILVFLLFSQSHHSHAQGITLDSLLYLGLRKNPNLATFKGETDVVASDTLLASTPRNPELGIEVGYNLTDPGKPKASAKVSKDFQLGVRHSHSQVTKANIATNRQLEKSREKDIAQDIRSSFYSWQILSRKKLLQIEVEKRWEILSRLATAKVKEGRLSQVEEAQAKLNLAKGHLNEMEIQTEMETIFKTLEYLTGTNLSLESIAPIALDSLPPAIPLDSLIVWALLENPELKILAMETESQIQDAYFQKSLSNPPVTLSLGYDRETDGANLLGAGISLPIPFYNRNRSGIAKSQANLRLSGYRRQATEKKLKSEVEARNTRLQMLAH